MQYLLASDICITPYLEERQTSSGVLSLALAAGKAVVASCTGPGPEVIEDGVTGLLANPHDPNSIAEKVITLLKDADLRRKMGSAARKVAVERYSLDKLVERNLQYYRRLIEAQEPQHAL